MQTNTARRIILAGATLSIISVVATAPAAHALDINKLTSVQPTKEQLLKTDKLVKLVAEGNAAVDVTTDLNCTDHTLTATVTNKTQGDISPNVTFNKLQPTYPNPLPIKPGEKATYMWSFSGNHLLADVNVQVDTFKDLSLSPMINCSEPVSFEVTDTSTSMVAGRLTNNSSFVSQTVYTRINGGDVRVENLAPGESRLIALPFNSPMPNPQNAFVAIGTDDGYQGTYSVDLNRPMLPPIPLPTAIK